MEFLQPAEPIFLLDHHINFYQAHVLYLTARAEEIQRRKVQGTIGMSPRRLKVALNLLQHVANQWQLELEWANQLREQARIQQE
jgi:hypothetical protein